jgi:hypothetical protein
MSQPAVFTNMPDGFRAPVADAGRVDIKDQAVFALGHSQRIGENRHRFAGPVNRRGECRRRQLRIALRRDRPKLRARPAMKQNLSLGRSYSPWTP